MHRTTSTSVHLFTVSHYVLKIQHYAHRLSHPRRMAQHITLPFYPYLPLQAILPNQCPHNSPRLPSHPQLRPPAQTPTSSTFHSCPSDKRVKAPRDIYPQLRRLSKQHCRTGTERGVESESGVGKRAAVGLKNVTAFISLTEETCWTTRPRDHRLSWMGR